MPIGSCRSSRKRFTDASGSSPYWATICSRIPPGLVRLFLEAVRIADTKVVDEDVGRSAERLGQVRDRSIDTRSGRKVRGERSGPLRRLLGEDIRIEIGHDDLRPFLREQVGDRLTD